jgi:hypothetical protein
MLKRRAALRSFRSLVVGIGIIGFAGFADAQDFSGYPGFPAEHGWLYYLGIVALSAVAGALAGAFLSDKAKRLSVQRPPRSSVLSWS